MAHAHLQNQKQRLAGERQEVEHGDSGQQEVDGAPHLGPGEHAGHHDVVDDAQDSHAQPGRVEAVDSADPLQVVGVEAVWVLLEVVVVVELVVDVQEVVGRRGFCWFVWQREQQQHP